MNFEAELKALSPTINIVTPLFYFSVETFLTAQILSGTVSQVRIIRCS
jgi:hypothetical protein